MASDIREVLDDLGVKVHSEGKEISCSCPFHGDRHPSFSCNATSGLWICYSCGRGGSLPMLIREIGDSDADPDVVLREIKHKKIPTTRTVVVEEDDEPPPPEPLMIYAKYEGFSPVPKWALEARNLSPMTAQYMGIKWDKGWVIPIWSPEPGKPQESLWGWQWKRMSQVSNWPNGINKSKTLFGLKQLELHDHATVALVESPLDVVRLGARGVSAVAAFGAYVSKVQQQLLVEHADRILLALDNDKAGRTQTTKIFPYLSRQVPTIRVSYPEGVKDPGDMTDDQIEDTFCDVQRDALPIPKRRRRHDADPSFAAARPRARTRQNRDVDSRLRGVDRLRHS